MDVGSANRKRKIVAALIVYGQKIESSRLRRPGYFTPNLKADKLIWEEPLAFLFAVILDQGMRAERVWEIPYLLRRRLGHLDVRRIVRTKDSELVSVFNKRPKLHRFPKTMALRIKEAGELVLAKYRGDARNIWNDTPSSRELHMRFEEFKGIGQKKASMAVNILVRIFGVKLQDKKGIDVSYDIHVRRVFLRTGLVDKDELQTVVQTARRLYPDYPGILDNPAWVIGRKYCRPKDPKCKECPLYRVCPRRLDIRVP